MGKIVISELIRKYRKEKGISQESFGQMFGVSAQAVSKWEKEDCFPDIFILPKLAEVLGCSVNDFFENE